MADVTITGLPNAATLTGTERVPMDQAGTTVDASAQAIANLATAATIGLGNVNNTSDLAKPISTATQAALDLKAAASAVSNVNNTSDLAKPISTATQAALDLKAAASHTQAASTITGLATVATSGVYTDLTSKPTLGTAAPLDVAATGDASATQVVKGNDSRLSDARTPAAHNQAASTITGLATVATSGSAGDLGAGTLLAARLPISGVTSGSYGSSTLVPVITVDGTGRITAASTAAVSGGGGGVSSVTGTAPIVSSGGTTPAISISAATTSTPGSMSAADKTKLDAAAASGAIGSSGLTMATARILGRSTAGTGALEEIQIGSNLTLSAGILNATVTGGGGGTVTSVGLSLPSLFSISGSPVTTAGTLTAALATQTANLVLAGPTTGSAAPTFRALVAADLPATTVSAGSYTYASLTVDAAGRITAASNGTAPLSVGTTTGTVAAGNDSRITGALSAATAASTYQPLTANLSSLGAQAPSHYLSRTNHTGTQVFSTVSMATACILGRTTAGSGAAEEITVGTGLSLTAGTLTATGGGGGGSGTKTLQRFTPRENQPPANNFATLNTRNGIAVLEFDAATQESSTLVGVIPEGANLASGLLVRIWWMAATATSGNVRWGASFEATGTDMDADSFDTVTQATSAASGISGSETVAEITCTAIDSLSAGNRFRLRIDRIAADASNDTMTGDAQMVAVEVRGVA